MNSARLTTTPRLRRVIDFDGRVEYFSKIVSSEVADDWYERALCEINWRQEQIRIFGKLQEVPRLSAWFSTNGETYTYSGLRHTPDPMPSFLQEINECITELTGLSFNGVLANLYQHGGHSVGWHSDDEVELGTAVSIASFSLGTTRSFRFRHRSDKTRRVSLEVDHGSLVMMYDPLQHYWMHELPKRKGISTSRVNFSFRKVQAEPSYTRESDAEKYLANH